MSTDRMDGELYFHCDTPQCHRNISFDKSIEFATAWKSAKRDGWSTFKIGSDWMHSCKTCTEEKLGGGRRR